MAPQSPSVIDFSCGFHENLSVGSRSSMRRVLDVSCSNSFRSVSAFVIVTRIARQTPTKSARKTQTGTRSLTVPAGPPRADRGSLRRFARPGCHPSLWSRSPIASRTDELLHHTSGPRRLLAFQAGNRELYYCGRILTCRVETRHGSWRSLSIRMYIKVSWRRR